MITNMRLAYAHLYKHQEKLGLFFLSPGVLYFISFMLKNWKFSGDEKTNCFNMPFHLGSLRKLIRAVIWDKGNEKQFELAWNLSYWGKFQWNFDQEKGNFSSSKLAGNSSYPSLIHRGSSVLCSGSFSHHPKFYSFMFVHKMC